MKRTEHGYQLRGHEYHLSDQVIGAFRAFIRERRELQVSEDQLNRNIEYSRRRIRAALATLSHHREIYGSLSTWPMLLVTQVFGVCFNLGVLVPLLIPPAAPVEQALFILANGELRDLFDQPDVARETRRAGIEHDELIMLSDRDRIIGGNPLRGSVEETAVFDEAGGIGEKRLGNDALGNLGTVAVGGVDEVDAEFDGPGEQPLCAGAAHA